VAGLPGSLDERLDLVAGFQLAETQRLFAVDQGRHVGSV
jgi:hypothetical protein